MDLEGNEQRKPMRPLRKVKLTYRLNTFQALLDRVPMDVQLFGCIGNVGAALQIELQRLQETRVPASIIGGKSGYLRLIGIALHVLA